VDWVVTRGQLLKKMDFEGGERKKHRWPINEASGDVRGRGKKGNALYLKKRKGKIYT